MKQHELDLLMNEHERWLQDNRKGKKLVLNNANLQGLDLSLRNLTCADFEGSDFSSANLRKTRLVMANLKNARFMKAYLFEADFEDARMCGAKLVEAKANRANFRNTHLKDADFAYSDLEYANFKGAGLKNAVMNNANLMNANLFGAIMNSTSLRFANLSGVNAQRIIGQKIISCQINPGNSDVDVVSFWMNQDIWVTGWYDGPLDGLLSRLDHLFLDYPNERARYQRAIDYVQAELEIMHKEEATLSTTHHLKP